MHTGTNPGTLRNAPVHAYTERDSLPRTHTRPAPRTTRVPRTRLCAGRPGPWAGARTVTGGARAHSHSHTLARTRTHSIQHARAARGGGGRSLWCEAPPARRGGGARLAGKGRGLRWGRGGGRSRLSRRERAPLRAALGLASAPPARPPRSLPRARRLAGPPPPPQGAAERPRRARGTGWKWGWGAGIGAGPGPRRPRCRAPAAAAAAGARDGARGCGGRQHLPAGDPGGRGAAAAAAAAAAETQRAMGELTPASWGAPRPLYPRAARPPAPRLAPPARLRGPLPERDLRGRARARARWGWGLGGRGGGGMPGKPLGAGPLPPPAAPQSSLFPGG